MKLEFKHIAYIALAIMALYLVYRHLVKGSEASNPDKNTNGNLDEWASILTATQREYPYATGKGKVGYEFDEEMAVVRPNSFGTDVIEGKDPHIVVHYMEGEGGYSNYYSETQRTNDTNNNSTSSGTSTDQYSQGRTSETIAGGGRSTGGRTTGTREFGTGSSRR